MKFDGVFDAQIIIITYMQGFKSHRSPSLSTAMAIFNFNQQFFSSDGDVSLAMAMRHQRWRQRWRFFILPSNSFLMPQRCFSNINKNLIIAHIQIYLNIWYTGVWYTYKSQVFNNNGFGKYIFGFLKIDHKKVFYLFLVFQNHGFGYLVTHNKYNSITNVH